MLRAGHSSRGSRLLGIVIALCVGAFALVSVGCGSDESSGGSNGGSGGDSNAGGVLEKAKAAGKVKVGFVNTVPTDYLDESGRLTGENPEVVRAVMKELGVPEIEGVLTKFESLIPGLLANRFDIIAGSMAITPERCREVIFSEPDFIGLTAFIVKEGNPKGITSYETIRDAKVGVIANAVDLTYLRGNDIPESQISQFPDQASLVDGVRTGRIDAATSAALILGPMVERGGEGLEVTEPFLQEVDGKPAIQATAVAFRKEDTALRDAFNVRLQAMKRDGRLARLLEPFGITREAVDGASKVTTEQLCNGEEVDI